MLPDVLGSRVLRALIVFVCVWCFRLTANMPPGKARQYLIDNFTLNADVGACAVCRNGHVLMLFFENKRSLTRTARSVCDKFGFIPTTSQIACLVKLTKNMLASFFRYPDRQRLKSVCQEAFVFRYPPPTSTSPNPESVSPQHPALQSVTVSPTCQVDVSLPVSSSVATPMKPALLSTISPKQHTKRS